MNVLQVQGQKGTYKYFHTTAFASIDCQGDRLLILRSSIEYFMHHSLDSIHFRQITQPLHT